jgi:nucleoside-diphosphate-sugar epimerase
MTTDAARSVLVTGAGGFLGAWAIKALTTAGRRVTAFDLGVDRRRIEALIGADAAAAIPWIEGDVRDREGLMAAIDYAGADAILHLAGLTIPACRLAPIKGAEVNVVGQIAVFEAALAKGVERLVYTSSTAAHPRGRWRSPANLYGVFKRAAEEIAKVYALEHGLMSVGVRPQIVYGLGRDDGETSAISQAIRAAALGETYAMPFAGEACLQYAGEIADVLCRCLDARPTEPVVSDITTNVESTNDLLAEIRRQVPKSRITPSAKRRAAPEITLDANPLERLIGPWPRVPLSEGISRTIDAYRRRGPAC